MEGEERRRKGKEEMRGGRGRREKIAEGKRGKGRGE